MPTAAERFARLSTPTKLLLILTAALLPIGFGLVWVAYDGIREANAALKSQADEQARIAAREGIWTLYQEYATGHAMLARMILEAVETDPERFRDFDAKLIRRLKKRRSSARGRPYLF